MNIANAAMIFGVVFLLAGLAGFFATPPPPGAPPLIVGMVMRSRSASFPSTRCTLSICCSACSALPRPVGRWSRRVDPAQRRGQGNQYDLRGFNLDHGTDFSTTVAGVPVNTPTGAHAHGYADVSFLIPELVSGVQFKKGPVLRLSRPSQLDGTAGLGPDFDRA